MNTGKSNGGSGDRPIFIAVTSKNCVISRKRKTKHYFTLFGRHLIRSKGDHVAKLREKIRKRRTSQGTKADAAR